MPDRAPDLDLHPCIRDPDKARAIIDACIADSVKNGTSLVRVIHGKGKGNFRNLIQSHLGKHPDVEGYVLCDPLHGGSGATWVHIRCEETSRTETMPEVERPKRPAWRWLLYFAFLITAFLIFPEPWVRAILVIFIFWFELRMATRQYSKTEEDSSGSDS